MLSEYTERLKKIEAVLDTELPQTPDAAWAKETFSGPASSIKEELLASLSAPGRDLVNRGGKRWRPLLMTLICEALGGGDRAVPLSPLVEFPHNASLIHDDIEDNSDRRRGKPAVHLIYGADTAINSGSFLYFHGLCCLSRWDVRAEDKLAAFELWGIYMRRLHLGQAMDIAWHRDFSSLPGLEEYETMCRLKTGVLARMAAVLGVHAAGTALCANRSNGFCGTNGSGANDNEANGNKGSEGENNEAYFSALKETLGRAAENLGLGFQILDDVKNLTTGNPGKKRGDDIVEGKKSLPVLLYLHKNRDKRDFAGRCFSAARKKGTGAAEVETLIAALEEAGAIEEARTRGLALIAQAEEALRTCFAGDKPFLKSNAAPSQSTEEGRRLLSGFIELLR
ncbi:MAG: polyprenyl synthetase family protein [Spirochaetaceae bacterium]|jgi:octaprenyl-diphosphate synthase|nr:polyprenyl synthetase family protein [Spirochaetaceae bacterium]